MKSSVRLRASSSVYCTGGVFMKYEAGAVMGPFSPRSSAIFAQRTASITTPAELGESHTSSFSSRLSGTLPKVVPSMRM